MIMGNPFKEILTNQELPEILKQKVLDDVSAIKLTIDIADLFVIKFPSTIVDLMGGVESQSYKLNKEKLTKIQ